LIKLDAKYYYNVTSYIYKTSLRFSWTALVETRVLVCQLKLCWILFCRRS